MLTLSFQIDEDVKVATLPYHGFQTAKNVATGTVRGVGRALKSLIPATTSRQTGTRAAALQLGGVPEALAGPLSNVSIRGGLGYGSLLGMGYGAVTPQKDEEGRDVNLLERMAKGTAMGAGVGALGAGAVKSHVNRLVKPNFGLAKDLHNQGVEAALAQGHRGPMRMSLEPGGGTADGHRVIMHTSGKPGGVEPIHEFVIQAH